MRWLRFIATVIVANGAGAPASAQSNVFVGDFYNNSILRINTTTGLPTPPTVASVFLPAAMTYSPGNILHVSSQATASVVRIDPVTGASLGTFNLSASPVQVPSGLAFAPNGDLFVADFASQTTPGTGTVKRFSSTGTFLGTVATGLNQPSGLLYNAATNRLYITEVNTSTFAGGRLSVYDGISTQTMTTGAAATGFSGMALSGNTLYYTDLLGGSIHRHDVSTLLGSALPDFVAPGTPELNGRAPSGVLVESSGSVLVSTLGSQNPPLAGNGQLLRYSSAGAFQTALVNGIFGSDVIVAVPEPSSLMLGGAALAGLATLRRRRTQKA